MRLIHKNDKDNWPNRSDIIKHVSLHIATEKCLIHHFATSDPDLYPTHGTVHMLEPDQYVIFDVQQKHKNVKTNDVYGRQEIQNIYKTEFIDLVIKTNWVLCLQRN